MKAVISATVVRIDLELSQREFELLHALVKNISGFDAAKVSAVPGSAEEYTAILYVLSKAFGHQPVREITSGSGDNRSNPTETVS